MTKSKSKSKEINLPTVAENVDVVMEINALSDTIEQGLATIRSMSVAMFRPFAEMGADASYMAKHPKAEKNNLKHTVRNYFVDVCTLAVVGQSGADFLNDKKFSRDAEFEITEGTMAGQTKSKHYIQQQYGKLLNKIKKAVADDAKPENPEGKTKTVNDDFTRFLNALGTAEAQTRKGKPDNSIPETVKKEFAKFMESLPALIKAEKTTAL